MTRVLKLSLLVTAVLAGMAANAQDPVVTWSAFTSGFGAMSGGNTRVQAVAGQTFSGRIEGPGISVGSGFLSNPDITAQQFSLAVLLEEGWNLLSLPVTRDSSNDSVRQAFPTATYEHGFAYIPDTGYVQEFRLTNRIGYWIKFPAEAPAIVGGEARLLDTLFVVKGWNLVGSISAPVDTATVMTDPPGNRISLWFGYSGGFAPVDSLIPGHGYWVKAETTGTFVLSATPTRNVRPEKTSPLATLNSLVITDAQGRTQTLYFGDGLNGGIDPAFYEMPPGGPDGAFDVRFESQRLVERVLDETPISFRSAAYPLTLQWNILDASQFTLHLGEAHPLSVSGTGRVSVTDHALSRIVIAPAAAPLPLSLRLDQNYPNPFNPSTTIEFAVPAGSATLQRTTLQVFDLLGRRVATLVDGAMAPGVHSARFDASGLASGVYIYRLQVGSTVQSRRMLLVR